MSTTFDPEPATAGSAERTGSERRRLPGASRRFPRITLAVLGVTAFVLGASGWDSTVVFHQYSVLKWALLIAAPLLVIVFLTVERPSAWAMGLVAITIPVEPYVATIHGQPVSVLLVILVVATFVVEIEAGGRRRSPSRTPALVRILPFAMVLLLIPTATGVQPLHELFYVLAFVDIAWICVKVGRLYPDGRLLIVLFFVGSASLQALVALTQYVTNDAFNLYGGAGTATYSAQTYFFDYGTTARTTGTFFDPISLGNVLAMALPLAVLCRAPIGDFLVASASAPPAPAHSSSEGSPSRSPGPAGWARPPASWPWRPSAAATRGDAVRCSPGCSSSGHWPRPPHSMDRPLRPDSPRSCIRRVRTSGRRPKTRAGRRTGVDALAVFKAHPITGVGFGNLVESLETAVPGNGPSSQAQDTYLQYMAEGGIFGAGVLLLLIGGVCADLHRTRRSDWLYPGLVGASVGVAVTWVTDVTVRYYSVAGCLAILVGLIASASAATGGSPPDGARPWAAKEIGVAP